jgi:L-alanine-DL-glutamate epimerase-like enolase superfamily enzyme
MARIDAVDLFYLSMPQVEDVGDGSQDALVVRVVAGGEAGWGECEAAPLPSIASLVAPMSHSACHPVQASVLGERLDEVADIGRIANRVRARSLDLLQADHTLSGIEMALWDLLGKRLSEPAWKLLGHARAEPRTPYASALFGDDAQATLRKARAIRARGFRAAKFGWGPFGAGSLAADEDQLHAAREGLGADGVLLVDAGTVWVADVEAAEARLPALEEVGAVWLEEPFVSGALDAYAALAKRCRTVRLAGGEGSHNAWMGRHMIDHGGVGFVQIDAGRIGGLGPAKEVADHAVAKGVIYVNHTFTSQLALAASLQPYASHPAGALCEYPVEAKPVAGAIAVERLERGPDGLIRLPDRPGLGMTVDPARFRPWLVDVEIKVGGRTLYRTPDL